MRLKLLYHQLEEIIRIFINTGMIVQGAALAYYTFFAIAPLLIVALAIAGMCFGPEAANKELFGQINTLVGNEGGQAIQAIVTAAAKPKHGLLATAITAVAFLFGAAGVFVQLQNSLNLIWQVRSKQGHSLRGFIRHRFLSFAMVLGVGFLLLVSLLLSAILATVGGYLGSILSARVF
jgi:membrane protein